MAQRLRFDIPFLPRMEAATSTPKLWRSISNDAADELQWHIRGAFGRDVLLLSDDSDDTWQQLQLLRAVLGRATRVLSYALTARLEVDEVLRLERWLASDTDVPAADRAVMERILRHLKTSMSLGDLTLTGGASVTLDSLVNVGVSGVVREHAWSSDEFDVFISYKHRLYSAAAERLRDALAQRGLKVWLDRAEMALGTDERIPNTEVRRRLQHALSVSRHTIFFETEAELHVDEDFRGSRTAYNWQTFEHLYARDVIYVDADGNLRFEDSVGPAAVVPGQPDVDFLAAYCRASSGPPRRSSFGPAAGGEPDLAQAGAALRRYLAQEFGDPVEVSPLAQIAMLAPGSSDRGADSAAYGGDVLTQLLRYDPGAALELARAGLNLYGTFAVGAKRHDYRWQQPRARLVDDIFGVTPTVAHRRVRSSRRVGTRELLLGILEFAAARTFARDVIGLALRAVRSSQSEDDLQHSIETFRTLAIKQLALEEREMDVHGWMLRQSGGRRTVIPIAGCGIYRPGDLRPVRVVARQSDRLFPSDVVAAFAQAIADGGAQHIDEVLGSYKEVALTLAGNISLSWGQDVSRPGIPGEIWVTPSEPHASLGLFSSEKLIHALEWLDSSDGMNLTPVAWPWGDGGWERIVLVTPPVAGGVAEPMTLLNFVADVLFPLDDYLALRVMEYDDF